MAAQKGVVRSGDYTFDASLQTITFDGAYSGFLDMESIMYITNVLDTVATVIYDPSDPLKGGSLTGLILTLSFDTTAMNDSDPLQIIIGNSGLHNDVDVIGDAKVDLDTIASDTTALNLKIAQISQTEDLSHSSGDKGVMSLAVRNDSGATTLTSTNGDYSPIAVDSKGSVAINDGGNTITVDGTVAVTGAGDATAANQATEITALGTLNTSINTLLKPANTLTKVTTVDTITNVVHVDDNAGSLTVDGSVTANAGTNLNTSALALAATQTDKSQFTKLTDGTDTALITGSGELNVIATAQPGVDIGDVTINNSTGAAAVNIQDGGNSITIDGSLTNISGTISLPTGAATAALQTQPGVDIGDVTINNANGGSAVNIQDGGNSITVDGTISVTGVATSANQATEIASLASIDTKLTNPLPVSVTGGGDASAANQLIEQTKLDTINTSIQNISVSVSPADNALTIDNFTDIIQPVADNIEQLLKSQDINERAPLYTQSINGDPLKDNAGALFLADGIPIAYRTNASTTVPFLIIDTTGYQTLVFHILTIGPSINITGSNDGVNWVTVNGMTMTSGVITNQMTANNALYVFPCITKYIRALGTSATIGNGFYQLRQQSWLSIASSNLVGVATNLSFLGSATIQTGGSNGLLGVGGFTAVGSAATGNPEQISGTDLNSIVRRVRTDTTGRVIIAANDPTTPLVGSLPLQAKSDNLGNIVLLVQDTTQSNGASTNELLTQILNELKLTNYILSELPQNLQYADPISMDIDTLRNELLN